MELDFRALFDEHYDEIAVYLRRRLMDGSAADDIAQLTFVEAYDRRATYDPQRGSQRGWLFGIATNLLRRQFRGEERQLRAYARAASRDIEPSDSSDETCSRLDAAANTGALAAALAALSRDERDVLTLYAWAELSYEEIAATLKIPNGTVKSRLNRARRRLRAALDPHVLEASHG